MNSWQDLPTAETLPFSLTLEKAAAAADVVPIRTVSKPVHAVLQTALACIRSGWRWLQRARAAQAATRRLRVTETVSLGEKRFLSIVQVDDAQFLIGTSATHVQLLAHLEPQAGEVSRGATV